MTIESAVFGAGITVLLVIAGLAIALAAYALAWACEPAIARWMRSERNEGRFVRLVMTGLVLSAIYFAARSV